MEFWKSKKTAAAVSVSYTHLAGRCLYQVLKVDRYNPTAQRYMAVAKHNTGKAEVEKRKLKNAFSHRQMQDDDIIIPPSYKENTGWQSVINILVGLVLGVAVVYFPVSYTHLYTIILFW